MSKRWAGISVLAFGLLVLASGAAGPPAAEAAGVRVTIGSASPGSGAYVAGGAFAAFVTKEVEGISMDAPSSKGFVFNIRAMERNKFDFMLNATGLVVQAVEGMKPFKKKYKHIRGFLPYVEVPYHVVVLRSSGIRTMDDLRGKRVNIADKGSITNIISKVLLDVAGLKGRVTLEYMSFAEGARALTDHRIDAFIQPTPLPAGNVLRAARVGGGIRLLPVSGEMAEEALKRMPGRARMTVPAGLYEGVDAPVKTIGHAAFFAVRDSVSAEVVYKILAKVLSDSGRKSLPRALKALGNIFKNTPGFEAFAAARVKAHPGVVRYWREKGVRIPEAVRP